MSELIIDEALEEMAKLKKKNAELSAHVERLREAGAEMLTLVEDHLQKSYDFDSFSSQPLSNAINETPAQSLQEIRREAMEEMRESIAKEFDNKRLKGSWPANAIRNMLLPIEDE